MSKYTKKTILKDELTKYKKKYIFKSYNKIKRSQMKHILHVFNQFCCLKCYLPLCILFLGEFELVIN